MGLPEYPISGAGVTVDVGHVRDVVGKACWDRSLARTATAMDTLLRTDEHKAWTGWLDLPSGGQSAHREYRSRIAYSIPHGVTDLVCVGIGGSYLGTRAAADALSQAPVHGRRALRLVYLGNHMDATEHARVLSHLEKNDFCINVISKSGTTTEPGIAFRMVRDLAVRKYGRKEASRRIIVTTDKDKGALRKMAAEENYATLVVPDDVGGRFSVLSDVGLFPLECAGVDVAGLLAGASEASACCTGRDGASNPALAYATARLAMIDAGKAIELLAVMRPSLAMFCEWSKQLFGESEGKDGKGLFPASVVYSTDLHSLGQWVQQGPRIIFETFLDVKAHGPDLRVPSDDRNHDGLNYLAGRTMDDVHHVALLATKAAHASGGVPCITVTAGAMDARHLGALFFTFEMTTALTGIAMGVNPFDQPGVESYKKEMFRLLGKPGA